MDEFGCHFDEGEGEKVLRWLEIVLEILFTRKQFTFISIIITFMVAT